MTWVKFKCYWQDGWYKYDPGKVVDIPSQMAKGYIGSGRAEACDPPKEILPPGVKKKRHYPSARSKINRVTSVKPKMSMEDFASEIGDE
jgi:hypothetical protein